jgi:hypothetical protein
MVGFGVGVAAGAQAPKTIATTTKRLMMGKMRLYIAFLLRCGIARIRETEIQQPTDSSRGTPTTSLLIFALPEASRVRQSTQ